MCEGTFKTALLSQLNDGFVQLTAHQHLHEIRYERRNDDFVRYGTVVDIQRSGRPRASSEDMRKIEMHLMRILGCQLGMQSMN